MDTLRKEEKKTGKKETAQVLSSCLSWAASPIHTPGECTPGLTLLLYTYTYICVCVKKRQISCMSLPCLGVKDLPIHSFHRAWSREEACGHPQLGAQQGSKASHNLLNSGPHSKPPSCPKGSTGTTWRLSSHPQHNSKTFPPPQLHIHPHYQHRHMPWLLPSRSSIFIQCRQLLWHAGVSRRNRRL